MRNWLSSRTVGIGAAVMLAASLPASAIAGTLTLTAAGTSLGFTLSTFATVNPGFQNTFNFGPFGVALTNDGHVLVSNYNNDTRYVFNDVDGQTTGSAVATLPGSGSGTVAYATAGGQAYGSVGGQFVQFNNNGTVNHVLSTLNACGTYLGMWGNPVNGHIIATSGCGLIDIDPLANAGLGSFRVINGAFGDGVSVSPDGLIAYLEQGAGISRFLISNGASAGAALIPGCSGVDGTGVISSTNALNGQIIANCNDGHITLIDPVTNLATVIAQNGSRGDYVSPDTSNGTLFLDMSEAVYRLSCGPNCAIGSTPPPNGTVPEPATFVLLGTGLAMVVARRVRRQ